MRGGSNFTQDYVTVDSNGSVGTAGAHTIGFHYPSADSGYLGAIALKPATTTSATVAPENVNLIMFGDW